MIYPSQDLKITVGKNKAFEAKRQAVASIDPAECINCGICRRACPTEAIHELQRTICRLCPDCAEGPQFFPDTADEFASSHACSTACPLGTVPEGYVSMIATGRFDEAYDLVTELNPLPGTLSRICNHPCMDECKRGLLIDKPINIRGLKRFVADRQKPHFKPFTTRYDIKIAIIGAGPAGITAAFDLAKKGYRVVIFEAGPEPGGMMNRAIPSFRLDKKVLAAEIKALEEAGIEIVYNAIIGKNPSIDDLFEDGYAAVIAAVGATKGMILRIEGTDGDTVYDAVSLMQKVNKTLPLTADATNKRIDYGNVIVIGGGSVALDTARALLRKGASSATCAFIETEDDMPAMKEEILDAQKEGIRFVPAAAPSKIITEWTTVKGVEFKAVTRIEADSFGRLSPVTKNGSEFNMEADTVVFATGQKPDLRFIAKGAGLDLNEAGLLDYDPETLMTSKKGLFLAGDTITGKGSVIEAMASGRKAALMVDNMIQERGIEERPHEIETADISEKIFPVMLEKLSPQVMPENPDRNGFEEIELGFDEFQAVEEAKRCMKCGFEKVDEDRCIGCGVCSSVCPANAITMVSPAAEEVN